MTKQFKLLIFGASFIICFILFLIVNPFSYNEGGSRTVVTQSDGHQFVRFAPGIFYSGFFAKETEWPNRLSITYKAASPNFDLVDNGIEVGKIKIMFSDGSTADVAGTAQFLLPNNEREMLLVHNTHRSPQSLVTQVLSDFTKECAQSSAQLMNSEKHYGGGKISMAQDFLDQLRNGSYLSSTNEKVVYDSIEKENRRYYITEIKKNKKGEFIRKPSPITEYQITVITASIVDTDYEPKIKEKMAKIIDASTKSAISKQDLMTAQQKTLTAKVEGEQKLVEIEYAQKQDQTRQVVAAETKVKLAEQDKIQQKIAYEGSILEALKIKTLADAEAYSKQKVMIADGALDKKLATYERVQAGWADAFSKYQGNIVPAYMVGSSGNSGNAMQNFMEMQNAKAMRDLNLNLSTK